MSETSEVHIRAEEQKPIEIDRHDERIMQGLQEAPVYKKQGEVQATIAKGGEIVVTKLADGSTETRNTAKEGDAIITNPGGEQYIIDAIKFSKRYEAKVGEDGKVLEGAFSARGYCKAIDNPWDQQITMMASWGEMQNGARDAKIADTWDNDSRTLGGEPYIIGRAEFAQTYKLADIKSAAPVKTV